ncbi:MAG: hypothetical protein ACRC33_21535 [Gemmataceae bacterium]
MSRHCRPSLEPLEFRCVPATVVWTGAINSRWEVGRNWDAGRIPTADDVAVIDKAGAVVQIRSGSRQAGRLLCTQTLEISGGTLTLGRDGAVTVTRGRAAIEATIGLLGATAVGAIDTAASEVANVRLLGGTLDAHGLEVTDSLVWGGGTLQGTGTVVLSGSAALNGGNKTLGGVDLINAGGVAWTGGRVRAADGGTFINTHGATFLIAASGTRFDPALVNHGTVAVASAGTAETGAFTQAGTLELRAGKLNVQSFVQTAGLTVLKGGTLASGKAVVLAGGTLAGAGTVAADVNDSAGRIAPGGGNTLVIAGNLTMGGASSLVLVATLGGGSDQVVVTGQAALGGELSIQLVGVPTEAVRYIGLTAAGVTGAFRTVRASAPGATVTVTVGAQTVAMDVAPVAVRREEPADEPAEAADDFDDADASGEEDGSPDMQLFGGRSEAASGQPAASYGQSPLRLESVGGGADLGGARKAAASREASGAARPDEPLEFGDVLAALPAPALPELEPESDADLLGAADLVTTLLLGGLPRARLSQGGASLSAVATFLGGDDAAGRAAGADADLGMLLIDPVGRLGGWPDAAGPADGAEPDGVARAVPAAAGLAGLFLAAREVRMRRRPRSCGAGRERREGGE